jgi:hypothetical protein
VPAVAVGTALPRQAMILRRLSIVLCVSPAEQHAPPEEGEPPMTPWNQLGGQTWSQRATPRSAGARPVRGLPTQLGAPVGHAPEVGELDYVLWIYLGSESVFFYPPGSVEEHLVVEHGIPSVDMHWKVTGYYNHEGDHLKQRNVRSGAGGDLLVITHAHEQAA